MSRPRFTLEEGLLVQFANLTAWKRKLNTKTYKALAEECHQQNKLLSLTATGHHVFRGDSLTSFVLNYNPTKQ